MKQDKSATRIRFAVTGFLALGLLAGCVAPAAPAAEAPAAPAEPVVVDFNMEMTPEQVAYYTPARYDGLEINVVANASHFDQELDRAAMEGLRDRFNELSGASVNYVILPENEMYDKVRLELAADSGEYCMMETGAGGAKDFGLSGFLLPIPAPPDVDDFYAGDVAQYSIGGELYGMPKVADTNLLYWRTDLFEEAGLDPTQPPATYAEFAEYAKLLTVDVNGVRLGEEGFDPNNIAVYGSAFKGVAGLASNWEYYNYLYAFGGDLFDENYEPTLDSPEAIAALEWVKGNLDAGVYPADIATYDYTEFHNLFAQGKIAMGINWPYMWGILQDPAASQVVDKVAVGRKPGEVTHGGNIGGWSWNVFSMCPHPELAIDFAKWMASPDASLAYADANIGNPVRKSVAEIMGEKDPVLLAAINANLGDGRGVAWIDTGPSWMEIEKVQHQAIQEVLIGAKDPATAFTDANVAIKELLTANGFYDELLPQLQGQ
ncbi:MAG: ABC transporter substrate-binding protein [Caldilineaceae bacterium]